MQKASALLAFAVVLPMALISTDTLAKGDSSRLRKDLKSKQERVRLEAVELLSTSALDNASSLIASCLRDPSPKVRVAAARALGVRRDRTALALLLRAVKSLRKDEVGLAAVCGILGEIGSSAAVGPLAGVAKREMSRNAELTKAAVSGLGKIRDKESVKELIGLLGSATPTSSGSTYSYGHPELLAPIQAALTELTGERLGAHPVWAAWWRRVKRGYRFPKYPGALLDGNVFRDEVYLFEVERPSTTRWEFTRPEGALLHVRFRGPKQEATRALLQVRAYNTRDHSPSTPEELADRFEAEFENLFKDIKESETDRRQRLSNRPAISQRLVGLTRHGSVVEIRQWIAVYRGNLFTVRATVSSGASEEVKKELDVILHSFKFI